MYLIKDSIASDYSIKAGWKCEEYKNLWFKGRLDSNGNYEFTTNSEELSFLLESL